MRDELEDNPQFADYHSSENLQSLETPRWPRVAGMLATLATGAALTFGALRGLPKIDFHDIRDDSPFVDREVMIDAVPSLVDKTQQFERTVDGMRTVTSASHLPDGDGWELVNHYVYDLSAPDGAEDDISVLAFTTTELPVGSSTTIEGWLRLEGDVDLFGDFHLAGAKASD